MKHFSRIAVPIIVLFVFMGVISADIANFTKERPIAIVRRFKPDVTIQNNESDKSVTLDLTEDIGEKLFSGDSLITHKSGYALVVFMDNSLAKVKPQSLLVIKGEVGNSSKYMSTRINLEQGEIHLNIQPQGSNDFEVATSRSLASVKGTEFGNRSDGFIWVNEGQVDVTALNSGQTVSLFDKMFAQVDESGNDIESGTLSDEKLESLDEGYNQLESDLIQKEIILRFRDQNGQIREVTIEAFEKQ